MSYDTYSSITLILEILGWSAFVSFLWLMVICVGIMIYQDFTKEGGTKDE